MSCIMNAHEKSVSSLAAHLFVIQQLFIYMPCRVWWRYINTGYNRWLRGTLSCFTSLFTSRRSTYKVRTQKKCGIADCGMLWCVSVVCFQLAISRNMGAHNKSVLSLNMQGFVVLLLFVSIYKEWTQKNVISLIAECFAVFQLFVSILPFHI